MYIKQFIKDRTENLGHAQYIKLANSWSNFNINIQGKMTGGTKTYTVKVGDDTYQVYVNKTSDLDVPISANFSNIHGKNYQYAFITKDGSSDCGSLIINQDKNVAYISLLYNTPGCVATETGDVVRDGIGTKLLNIMIEWCKLRKVTEIYLDDESRYHCKTKNFVPAIDLLKAHTMFDGVPWYFKFGFRFKDKSFDDKVHHNQQLNAQLKTSSVDKKDLMRVIKRSMKENLIYTSKEYEDIVKLYDNLKDRPFGEFVKVLQRDHCDVFAYVHSTLYDAIGYINYEGFYMVKKL
jgi:hypothetical protein